MNYTFHIAVYDIVFFTMIIVGLVFALLLGFVKNINRGANRFLGLAVVTMALWMARVLATNIRPGVSFPVQFLLALGPLLYFYVLKITRPKYQFRWKDLLHFSPLLLEQAMLPIQALNPLLQLLVFISLITYLYHCRKLIEVFYGGLPLVLMDRSRLEFRWLRRLLAATALLWCVWIAWATVDYFVYGSLLGQNVYYPFYILFAVIIIWTAVAAFLRPQAAVMANVPSYSPPVPAELRAKGVFLKKAMEAHRYFEDPELSLKSLAEKAGMHPHELSRVINTVLKKNFNDFINEYRVRDVITRMQQPSYDHMTLLGIAYEAGFNSQTSFNRIFKQLAGKSPLEYKNSLKNEQPTYHLGNRGQSAAVISSHQANIKWAEVKLNRTYMFRNYVKTAWRNLMRHKKMTIINVSGLSIGIAATIIIMLWVQNELSFDKYHPGIEDLYRIKSKLDISKNDTWLWETSQYVLGDYALRQIPEIAAIARLKPNNADLVLHYQQKIMAEKKSAYVDEQWFTLFHYDFIEGSPLGFVKNPFNLILTSSAAKRYFGNEAAVGKVLRIDTTEYRVQAVVKDNPANSSFQYDVLIPMAARLSNPGNRQQAADWGNYNYLTFLTLRSGANPATAAAKLTQILRANKKDHGNNSDYSLIKVKDMHFESDLQKSVFTHGSRTMVNVFIVLGVLLLATACINYVNLTTARASARSKEVSIRKMAGAGRAQLFIQFMAESFLISVLAVVMALLLVELNLPWFKSLTGKEFGQPLYQPVVWLITCSTLAVAFLLNGIYPAAMLSSFQPLSVFKGKSLLNFKDSSLRKTLVVIQFTISVILITGTIIIYHQLRYIQTKDIGYDRSQVFAFTFPYWKMHGPVASDPGVVLNTLKQSLKRQSAITGVSLASTRLTDFDNQSAGSFDWDGRPKDFNPALALLEADADFQPMMHIKIAEGRWFNPGMADTRNVLLNETAVKTLQIHRPVLGQRFVHHGDTGVVIGVVKDFNYKSLHEKIGPMVIVNSPSGGFYVKTTGQNAPAAIQAARSVWQQFLPEDPFDYYFLDEKFNSLYKTEQESSVLIAVFAVIAILVSSLGLLGLAVFAAERKVKEIGVRKVLGASVQHIVGLLTTEFVKLVIVASLIAFPIAWWAMNRWLQDFAYRITLSWWIFVVSGAVALVIALATVSYQVVKAAVANPVKSLRSE